MTKKKKVVDLDGKIIDGIIREVAKDMGLESELLRDKETYESLQNIVCLCVGLYMAEFMPDMEDEISGIRDKNEDYGDEGGGEGENGPLQ